MNIHQGRHWRKRRNRERRRGTGKFVGYSVPLKYIQSFYPPGTQIRIVDVVRAGKEK